MIKHGTTALLSVAVLESCDVIHLNHRLQLPMLSTRSAPCHLDFKLWQPSGRRFVLFTNLYSDAFVIDITQEFLHLLLLTAQIILFKVNTRFLGMLAIRYYVRVLNTIIRADAQGRIRRSLHRCLLHTGHRLSYIFVY